MERAEKRHVNLEVPLITLIESVFTLSSFYKRNRRSVSEEIIKILNTPGINFRGPAWALEALEDFGGRKVAFGDACIVAEARRAKMPVASFDSDFDGLEGVTRIEPT
jgi:predicted nucleic-acid-binding protein